MFPQKKSRTTTSVQPDVRETLRKIRLVEPLIVLAVVVVRSLVETIKKGRVQLSHTPKLKGNLWKIVFAIAVLVCDPQF
jgi:Ni/Fe-hydrogenase subunit HybB-like protein